MMMTLQVVVVELQYHGGILVWLGKREEGKGKGLTGFDQGQTFDPGITS